MPITPTRLLATTCLAAASLLAACDTSPDALAGIDATGGVGGIVYVDLDGDTLLEPTDAAAADVRVELVPTSRDVAVDSARTGADGVFIFPAVPVGVYRVRIADADVPDSLMVTDVDSASFTVPAGGGPAVVIALSYPTATVAGARASTAGTRLFVTGVALSTWATFGDSTIHVRDTTGALRLVRVEPVAIAIGDTIRALGAAATHAGQPVLRGVRVFALAPGEEPLPADTLTTAVAATAAAGALDAELVHVARSPIEEITIEPNGDVRIVVDDGSGPLTVLFDAHGSFTLTFQGDPTAYELEADGLLVPAADAEGTWVLKPRGQDDVRLHPPA